MSSDSRIVLGLGTGQCGLNLLADILNQQVGASVTHEESPLLPWNRRPGLPGIRERFARWRERRPSALVGDCAHFYLPHVEEALELEPGLRVVWAGAAGESSSLHGRVASPVIAISLCPALPALGQECRIGERRPDRGVADTGPFGHS